MKQKYYGLLTATILLTAIVLSTGYAIFIILTDSKDIQLKRMPPLPGINAPSLSQIQAMDALQKRAPQLAYPPSKTDTTSDLSVFGYQPVIMPSYKRTQSHSRAIDNRGRFNDYKLTFVMTSKSGHICMINGMLMRTGDVLPGGETIKKITTLGVSIIETPNKPGLESWLKIGD